MIYLYCILRGICIVRCEYISIISHCLNDISMGSCMYRTIFYRCECNEFHNIFNYLYSTFNITLVFALMMIIYKKVINHNLFTNYIIRKISISLTSILTVFCTIHAQMGINRKKSTENYQFHFTNSLDHFNAQNLY